jgi:para-nitrobenzyl esterase
MNNAIRTGLFSLCLGLTLAAGPAVASDSARVDTALGAVQGAVTRIDGVLAWHGLPYAAPPTGDLRWRPPQPPAAWSGVRDGNRFGNRCMQTRPFDDMIWNSDKESEDCLYLSVWARAAARNLPVMVWIHGGGFASGSGGEARHDGARLASEGVVVVTLNYRLGVFGFLAHPDLETEQGQSGNYGLMDIVAALRWVRDHITAFGGDPGKVTILGESAGSFAVSALVASPAARGLFHRAIGQSGAMIETTREPVITSASAQAAGQAFARAAGVDGLAALRKTAAAELIRQSVDQQVRFRPVIDGHFLPQNPNTTILRAEHNDVALMVGWTSAETRWVEMGLEQLANTLKQYFPGREEQAARFYPAATDEQALRSGITLSSDFWLVYSTWKWAELQGASGKSPVYRYLFDQVQGEAAEGEPGAAHASDIPYVFDTLDYLGKPVSDADRKTSDLLRRYWVNFARAGDPNSADLPRWPSYNAHPRNTVMRFHRGAAAEPDPDRARLEFVDEVLSP